MSPASLLLMTIAILAILNSRVQHGLCWSGGIKVLSDNRDHVLLPLVLFQISLFPDRRVHHCSLHNLPLPTAIWKSYVLPSHATLSSATTPSRVLSPKPKDQKAPGLGLQRDGKLAEGSVAKLCEAAESGKPSGQWQAQIGALVCSCV